MRENKLFVPVVFLVGASIIAAGCGQKQSEQTCSSGYIDSYNGVSHAHNATLAFFSEETHLPNNNARQNPEQFFNSLVMTSQKCDALFGSQPATSCKASIDGKDSTVQSADQKQACDQAKQWVKVLHSSSNMSCKIDAIEATDELNANAKIVVADAEWVTTGTHTAEDFRKVIREAAAVEAQCGAYDLRFSRSACATEIGISEVINGAVNKQCTAMSALRAKLEEIAPRK